MLGDRTSGKASIFQISTLDADGVEIPATAANWKLFDARGIELATGVIAEFTGVSVVSFTVSAAKLTSAATVGREIVVTFTTAAGPVVIREYFLLRAEKPLGLMVNSYLTYPEALAVRSTIGADLMSWDLVDEQKRSAGLMDAFEKIARIRFSLPNTIDLMSLPSEYAAYGRGSDEVPYHRQRVNLRGMTIEGFDALPDAFKIAVKRAQIYEADAALGGDSFNEARNDGIMSETVGESSTTFNSKPYLKLPLCSKAYAELNRYVKLNLNIARA